MKRIRYESVVVLNPDLEEQAVNEQIEKISAVIAQHDGALESSDVWGRRQLAYRIRNREYGVYAVLIFSGDTALVAALDRQLKINESVLRHLIVRKDKHAPDAAEHVRQGGLAAEGPFSNRDTGDNDSDSLAILA